MHLHILQFLFLAADIEQLNRFPCGGYSDESTIVYLQHPCIILSALEVKCLMFFTILLLQYYGISYF